MVETRSCFLHGDYSEFDACPGCKSIGRPEPTLARRLGWMADAVVGAKTGPQGRFFSRERADEIALLLREAEAFVIDVREERSGSATIVPAVEPVVESGQG